MEPVEQLFLRVPPVDGGRRAEIVAATGGVRASDVTEIVGWFGNAGANAVIRFDTLHLFFHPLPSGDYALGMIYPEQRGFFSFLQPPTSFFARILTIPPRTLLEKANNPLALYEELRRRRKIPMVSKAPKHLAAIPPLPETPNGPPLNRGLLEALVNSTGPDAPAGLFQSLFDSECIFLHSSKGSVMSVLAGLFELLPLHYRTELTFSTDLFFSEQTPFRLIGLGGPRRQALEWVKGINIPLVLLEPQRNRNVLTKSAHRDPWPKFIQFLLQSRHRARYFDFLERQWAHEYRHALSTYDEDATITPDWEHLHSLAVSWAKAARNMAGSPQPENRAIPDDMPEAVRVLGTVEELLPLIEEENGDVDLAPGSPSADLMNFNFAENFPLLQEEFRLLDSSLAQAFFGDETVLPKIRETWKAVTARTKPEERELICEKYMALTRSVMLHGSDLDGTRRLERSAIRLELLAIFLEHF